MLLWPLSHSHTGYSQCLLLSSSWSFLSAWNCHLLTSSRGGTFSSQQLTWQFFSLSHSLVSSFLFLQWQVVFLMHSSFIHQILIQHQHCVMCSSESLGRYQWVVRGRKEKPCFRVGLDLWSAQILCMRSFFSIQVMFLAPWVEKHFFS